MRIILPTTPSQRLDGQRALITGAAGGIGVGAAAALAAAGALVTLCGRTASSLDDLATTLNAYGYHADTLVADVTDIEAMSAAINAADPFHILVNNAGTNRPGPFVEATAADFDLMMSLNIRAAYFTAQSVAKRMITTGTSGSIINMSSQLGHVGSADRSLYCATKWAMEGFSRCMAIELAPHGIRVNTLCPTFIETPLTKPYFENEGFKAEVLSRIKLNRLGTVEDLMGPVLFLASDASALMTGASLMIDGGWTAE